MALEKRHRIDPERCLSLRTETNLVSSGLVLGGKGGAESTDNRAQSSLGNILLRESFHWKQTETHTGTKQRKFS